MGGDGASAEEAKPPTILAAEAGIELPRRWPEILSKFDLPEMIKGRKHKL